MILLSTPRAILRTAFLVLVLLSHFSCGDDDSAPPPDAGTLETDLPPPAGDFASLRVMNGEGEWRFDGEAAVEGAALTSLPGHNAFWFAWSVFHPGAEVWGGDSVRVATIESDEECGVPCDEIIPGCSGRDCIPPLDAPEMVSEAPEYLADTDLVLGIVTSEGARAYPHNVLWWHEVVNEEVGGEAFAITFCPLTGSGLRFDRRGFVEGESVRLGVSGLLYNSNLVLWDRETETLWSQMRIEAIRGDARGSVSPLEPVHEMSWRAWRSLHPDTLVVSDNTGFSRDYTRYPYTRGGDYRTNHADTFRSTNPSPDDQFRNKDMVFGLVLGSVRRAYVWERLREQVGDRGVLNDEVDGMPIVIVFDFAESYVHAFERPSAEPLLFVSP